MNLLSFTQPEAIPARESPGSWDNRKERLKIMFPVLTDEDLRLEADNRDQMFENLLHKLNMTTNELHEIIIRL